jgi:hypothetical protein
MQIDFSEPNAKQKSPIRVNLEFDSNKIFLNRTNLRIDPLQQPLPRTSTDRGTQIDLSEQNAKQ